MKGVVKLIRGACQQFKFTTPYLTSVLDEITVYFKQYEDGRETVSLTKTKNDCQFIGTKTKTIYVVLNQDDTLRFSTDSKAYVQLKAKTSDGFVFASKIRPVTVYPSFDDSEPDNVPSSGELSMVVEGTTLVITSSGGANSPTVAGEALVL